MSGEAHPAHLVGQILAGGDVADVDRFPVGAAFGQPYARSFASGDDCTRANDTVPSSEITFGSMHERRGLVDAVAHEDRRLSLKAGFRA